MYGKPRSVETFHIKPVIRCKMYTINIICVTYIIYVSSSVCVLAIWVGLGIRLSIRWMSLVSWREEHDNKIHYAVGQSVLASEMAWLSYNDLTSLSVFNLHSDILDLGSLLSDNTL